MGNGWHPAPMQVTTDSGGRILLPKSLRDSLGLLPGTKADISLYGNGVQVTPGGRTARLEADEDGHLVARSHTVVTDDMVLALMDTGHR